MTTHHPTYKFERKLSVDKGLEEEEELFPYPRNSIKHPQFYTEKKINLHPNRHQFPDDGQPRVKFPSGMKFLHDDALSVLDQHERLEYSSTDQLSEISHTLAGLGARSGHSFQKQNLQFSLSSDIQDTEHENMLLRKKMNEMKKELREYRELDDKMYAQIKIYCDKAEKAKEETNAFKKQVQRQHQKVTQLESELEGKEMRIEELQRLLAKRERRMTEGKVSIMVEEVQNYKEAIRRYEDDIQQLKNYYEKEIFQNSKQYTTMIQQIHKQFQNAKVVGQRQIMDLMEQIKQKDQEISKLRNKIAHFDFRCKMSTLVSDNFSHNDRPNDPKHPSPSKYVHRFAKFSQFIDERIHKSCEKERNQRAERVSKSAVETQQFSNNLKDFRERIPNSPQSPSNNNGESFLKVTDLLQKNQQFKRQAHEFWLSS